MKKITVKKPLIKEHSIQNAVIRYLQIKKYLVIRYNSGSVKTDNHFIKFYQICNTSRSSGHPDIIAYKNNTVLFLEIKTEKGKLTNSQLEFQNICKLYGMDYYIIRNIDELIRVLNEHI